MKKMICSLIALVIASPVFSNDVAWNQHTGAYAELNVGTDFYYNLIYTRGTDISAGIGGFGWSGAVGYNFNPTFGLEGGFILNLTKNYELAVIKAPYVSTRFNVPLGERYSFIGKLGLMAPFFFSDGAILLPFTGIGISYAVSNKMDVSLQYQGAVYGVASAGLLSLGVSYHFD